MKRVAIVGHADADGHLIAEQARRNLAQIPDFEISVIVDPLRTRDHKAWLALDLLKPNIDGCDYVFFVDMMFAPASFAEEAQALVAFTRERPSTQFFLIDHHPIPIRRLSDTPNLRASYRPDVLDCTFGHPSFLMLVAALLEAQPTRAKAMKQPAHIVLAQGIRRAAAIGGPLPGEKLLALLRYDRWEEIEELGRDDPAYHRLVRGRRPEGSPVSKTLRRLDELATALLARPPKEDSSTQARKRMAYDFEGTREKPSSGSTAGVAERNPNPKDLEAIVLSLELAAIRLTDSPDATFSAAELLTAARELTTTLLIAESDIKIVLGKAGFLKKVGNKFQMK